MHVAFQICTSALRWISTATFSKKSKPSQPNTRKRRSGTRATWSIWKAARICGFWSTGKDSQRTLSLASTPWSWAGIWSVSAKSWTANLKWVSETWWVSLGLNRGFWGCRSTAARCGWECAISLARSVWGESQRAKLARCLERKYKLFASKCHCFHGHLDQTTRKIAAKLLKAKICEKTRELANRDFANNNLTQYCLQATKFTTKWNKYKSIT